MIPKLSPQLIEEIEAILSHGNRVELSIEQGKVCVIEIKRKLRFKSQ